MWLTLLLTFMAVVVLLKRSTKKVVCCVLPGIKNLLCTAVQFPLELLEEDCFDDCLHTFALESYTDAIAIRLIKATWTR